MSSFDFGGHRSKVKVVKGIIDKCEVHGDAALCVVIFNTSYSLAREFRRTFLYHHGMLVYQKTVPR